FTARAPVGEPRPAPQIVWMIDHDRAHALDRVLQPALFGVDPRAPAEQRARRLVSPRSGRARARGVFVAVLLAEHARAQVVGFLGLRVERDRAFERGQTL